MSHVVLRSTNFLPNQAVIFLAVISFATDTKSEFFNRQSMTEVYPQSHVFDEMSAPFVATCGFLCQQKETCLAFSYLQIQKTCKLVDRLMSDADLITVGRLSNESLTFKKASAAAPCTQPVFSDFTGASYTARTDMDVEAYLPLNDNEALIFLSDSLYFTAIQIMTYTETEEVRVTRLSRYLI